MATVPATTFQPVRPGLRRMLVLAAESITQLRRMSGFVDTIRRIC